MHVAVVGKGMIGSAAARHLAAQGHRVTLVGPDEPADFATHNGVFGAHYDAARIVRSIDPDPVWQRLAQATLPRLPQLEAASGLQLHHGCGFLAVSERPWSPGSSAPKTVPGHPFRLGTTSCLQAQDAPAGWVNPRQLVRAQTLIAVAAGAQLIRMPVWALRERGNQVRLILDDGSELLVDRALVCAGAFSAPLGLAGELPLQANGRITLLAQVTAAQRQQWADMPALIHQCLDAPLSAIYLVPPVRYPDGHWYLKLGTSSLDHPLATLNELVGWYREPAAEADIELLRSALSKLLPELVEAPLRTDACAVTNTPTGYPVIDWLSPGRVAVACGGNGQAAKCSDELGRLAASLIAGNLEESALMAPFRA